MDEQALKRFDTMTRGTRMFTRCSLYLLEVELDVVHCEAVKHRAPHALSRLRTAGKALADEIPVIAICDQRRTQNGSSGDV